MSRKHSIASLLTVVVVGLLPVSANASSARHAFETGYYASEDGEWCRLCNDEGNGLMGYETYVMKGLAEMYEVTSDPMYLERLAWHIDGVLTTRNDARGVEDYRGDQSACWIDTFYSGGEPYCWLTHSANIIKPFLMFADLVQRNQLDDELAYDGVSFAEKAEAYIIAAEETVDYHDDQWGGGGNYLCREDARACDWFAGWPLPLGMSARMAEVHYLLYDLTEEDWHLERAVAITERFASNLITYNTGYLWPYWPEEIVDNGMDIAHASVALNMAHMAYERGLVFDDEHIARFAASLTDTVALDDLQVYVVMRGVGDIADEYYFGSVFNWLPFAAAHPRVYTTVRNLYASWLPAEEITTSATTLYGWAMLARYAPFAHAGTLGESGWGDTPDPERDENWWQATSSEALLYTEPADLQTAGMVPVELYSTTDVEIDQWTGRDWAFLARWQATETDRLRHLPYVHQWPAVDQEGRIQFRLRHDPDAGEVWVREPKPDTLPTITSLAPVEGTAGATLSYTAEGSGDAPLWWSMTDFPTGARIDYATGNVTFTPETAGAYAFTVRLENDAGTDTQIFEYCVDDHKDCGGDTTAKAWRSPRQCGHVPWPSAMSGLLLLVPLLAARRGRQP